MATLVLTAVGSVIGGPVGGAIGGLLGQAVDRRVLRPKGRQGPRLTELAVQTSSYGTAIPKVFGRMRVAGCVIWATDLIETRRKQRGGKGQPSATTYSYAASFAVALSGRPIVGVGRVWAEGKLLRGAAGDFKTETGFRLHHGGEDQAADPLIAAAEGAANAPAHRGIAYAVFEDFKLAEYGNRIPLLTFEVIADAAPVTVGAIAQSLGLRGTGPAMTLDGFSAYGDSVRGVIETLAGPSGAWFVDDGGVVAMRDAVDEPIALVDAGVDGARRQRTLRPIETVPKALALAHHDLARDYQTGVQQVQRPGAGRRAERIELPAAIGAAPARALADAMMARAERARMQRVIRLDARAMAVAPGAGVTIAGERGTWRVTRAEIEGMAVALTLTPLIPAPQPARADPGRAAIAADELAGATLLAAFETPALDETTATTARLTIAVGGTSAGWRRAALLMSSDAGASWQEIGPSPAPATIARLAAPLGRAPATLTDMTNAIDVTTAHAGVGFAGADRSAIDQGANLLWIDGELIQFARAEQHGATRWRLSQLLRGRRGTSVRAVPAGATVVLLEAETALVIPLPAQAIGGRVQVMAQGVADAAPVAVDAIIDGSSVAPPSPVRLGVTRASDGSGLVTWRRRSRAGWRWRDGGDAPLVEEAEAYRVEVTTATGTRSATVAQSAIAVTAAEWAAHARVSVCQLGTYTASRAESIDLPGD